VALRVKNVSNFYVTEVTFETPVNLQDIQEWVRGSKSNAEVVGVISAEATGIFNKGGVLGATMKQRHRIPTHLDPKVREILEIKSLDI
jgi:hypothetical protein